MLQKEAKIEYNHYVYELSNDFIQPKDTHVLCFQCHSSHNLILNCACVHEQHDSNAYIKSWPWGFFPYNIAKNR